MKKVLIYLIMDFAIIFWSGFAIAEFEFNQEPDNELDSLGDYYAVTGGLFPTGTAPDGNNGSGGTFRYLLDDPTNWGPYTIDQWNKDDWFPENSGLALTLVYNGTTVYDNNGIEDGSGAFFYNYSDATDYFPGLYRGYSMVNNYDWIYATYFKLENETTVNKIIGYFDPTSGFDPYDPLIGYHMSIWSAYQDMPEIRPTSWMPTMASFTGDVLDSLYFPGTFSVSPTGIDRIFPEYMARDPDAIWRVVYELESPVTIPAGVYFFSHNAVILEEIVIEDCHSGVTLFPANAQSVNAALEECGDEATNHGGYINCVSRVLGEAVKAGVLSDTEKGAIESCAAQSDIGKK